MKIKSLNIIAIIILNINTFLGKLSYFKNLTLDSNFRIKTPTK